MARKAIDLSVLVGLAWCPAIVVSRRGTAVIVLVNYSTSELQLSTYGGIGLSICLALTKVNKDPKIVTIKNLWDPSWNLSGWNKPPHDPFTLRVSSVCMNPREQAARVSDILG